MQGEKYLYKSVYNSLKGQIDAGQIQPGEKLPTENELAEIFEVSRITVQKAMGMLVQEGYVIRRPGRGSFAGEHIGQKESTKKDSTDTGQINGKKIIGLIMEDFSAGFGIEMLKAIDEEAQKRGYLLCVKRSCGKQEIEKKMLQELMEAKAAGIILMPTHGQHYNTEILKMVGEGMPLVFIDRYLEGLPVPFVGSDNKKAMKDMIFYLSKRGYKKIGYITPPAEDAESLQKRVEGYCEACEEYGIKCGDADLPEGKRAYLLDTIRSTIPDHQTISNREADEKRIEQFLKDNPQLEAIMTAEYDISILTEQVCQKMGMRVPEDLMIACFDGPVSSYGEYGCPHIRQQEEKIGKTAVDLLEGLIQGKKQIQHICYEATIVK